MEFCDTADWKSALRCGRRKTHTLEERVGERRSFRLEAALLSSAIAFVALSMNLVSPECCRRFSLSPSEGERENRRQHSGETRFMERATNAMADESRAASRRNDLLSPTLSSKVCVLRRPQRSADFQSAVSQNSILPRTPKSCRLPLPNLQPIGKRRYGRLEICATGETDAHAKRVPSKGEEGDRAAGWWQYQDATGAHCFDPSTLPEAAAPVTLVNWPLLRAPTSIGSPLVVHSFMPPP